MTEQNRHEGWRQVLETDMRGLITAIALVALTATSSAMAQTASTAPLKPSSQKPVKNPTPSDEPSGGYAVSVAPDRSATAMADPGSAAEFGSPSVTDSPSSPMPNPNAWPTIHRSAKRPDWVKKAPPEAKTPPPPH
jgi:hypothetical protein